MSQNKGVEEMKKKILSILLTLLLLIGSNPLIADAWTLGTPYQLGAYDSTAQQPYSFGGSNLLGYQGPKVSTYTYFTLNVPGKIVESKPVITVDGTSYVGAQNGNYYAVNPDGTLKWKYTFPDAGKVIRGAAIASDGTVYAATINGYLYALNPNGTLKWSYSTGTTFDVNNGMTLDSSGVIYLGGDDGYLHAINPNGTVKWKYRTDQNYHSASAFASTAAGYSYEKITHAPVVGSDGTIYFGSEDFQYQDTYSYNQYIGGTYVGTYGVFGDLYAINPNGTLKWKGLQNLNIKSRPILANGKVYALVWDDGSTSKSYTIIPAYYYGYSPKGRLIAINQSNGTLSWQSPDAITSDNIYRLVITDERISASSDGTIYLANGKVYAYNPDGSLKWTYNGYTTTRNSIIDTDGTLYFSSFALDKNGSLASTAYGGIPYYATFGSNKTLYYGTVNSGTGGGTYYCSELSS